MNRFHCADRLEPSRIDESIIFRLVRIDVLATLLFECTMQLFEVWKNSLYRFICVHGGRHIRTHVEYGRRSIGLYQSVLLSRAITNKLHSAIKHSHIIECLPCLLLSTSHPLNFTLSLSLLLAASPSSISVAFYFLRFFLSSFVRCLTLNGIKNLWFFISFYLRTIFDARMLCFTLFV